MTTEQLGSVYVTDDQTRYDFDALRDYFRRAVTCGLQHATGSLEGWRTASVEQLADSLADHLTAGVTPVMSETIVKGGVKVAAHIIASERAKAAKE